MTKFVNPNNPLRRQAAAAAPRGAARPAQAPARQAPARKIASAADASDESRTAPRGIPTPLLEKFASRGDEGRFDETGTFNPKRFAGHSDDGAVRRVIQSSDRMYDARGEMNAYDKKDALTQAAYLLNHVTRQSPAQRLTRQASMQEKEASRKVLAAALNDPTGEGFALVGQELALPIKAIIDYEGWIRKILRVRTLHQGELFRIAKDVRATAYVVGQDGQGIETRVKGQYVQPDEAKITSFPTVDMMDLLQMNYDVLDRLQDTARQEIELQEDHRGHALLSRASAAKNTVSTFANLNISVLENLRYQVERHRLIVDKFLLNRAEISDVQINMSGALDPVTQRELNLAGYFGRFLGAHILTCAGTGVQEVIPAGTLYAVTSPEYLGEMGIRQELFSEPFNGFNQFKTIKGWAFIEVCGFGIPQPQAIAKAVRG